MFVLPFFPLFIRRGTRGLHSSLSGVTRADVAAGLAVSNRRDAAVLAYQLKKNDELELSTRAAERQQREEIEAREAAKGE